MLLELISGEHNVRSHNLTSESEIDSDRHGRLGGRSAAVEKLICTSLVLEITFKNREREDTLVDLFVWQVRGI